ncbi:MAG: hypothetical protein ACI85I_001818 [Arenicella sp.]|jgi:hypothetical protein
MLKNSLFIFLAFSVCLLTGCGSKQFATTPIDDFIKKMDKEKNFTIILYDMDVEGSWSKDYKHKYKIITETKVNDSTFKPEEKTTDWMPVDENFFEMHANDMGMEIAAKTDGKVTKQTAPPGYSNYVGNKQYGNWQTNSSGGSFWAFYGQYAFMSNMMGLMGGRVSRTGYSNYNSTYRGVRPYYGTSTAKYGTFSAANKAANPSFAKKMSSNSSFKSKVQSSASRSTTAKNTRSGSRYSSGSSRGRSSGGGGK